MKRYIYVDVRPNDNSDELIAVQFEKSMESDNKRRIELNAPIAKYDVVKKKAYLEYPDGKKVYEI